MIKAFPKYIVLEQNFLWNVITREGIALVSTTSQGWSICSTWADVAWTTPVTPVRAPLNDVEPGLSRGKPRTLFQAVPLSRVKGWAHRMQDVLRWVFPLTWVSCLRDPCALLRDVLPTVLQLSASIWRCTVFLHVFSLISWYKLF